MQGEKLLLSYRDSKKAPFQGEPARIDVHVCLRAYPNQTPYFSCTGTIYSLYKNGNAKETITCGCIHDPISRHFPDLQPFIDLHLSNVLGHPVHMAANAFYWMKQNKLDTLQHQLRMSDEEMKQLQLTDSENHLAYQLIQIGVVDRCAKEAREAIALLEELTEQALPPIENMPPPLLTDEQMAQIAQQIAEGHFTPEAIQERANQKRQAAIEQMKKKYQLKAQELKEECQIYATLMEIGFDQFDATFFHHNRTLRFRKDRVTLKRYDELVNSNQRNLLPPDIQLEWK